MITNLWISSEQQTMRTCAQEEKDEQQTMHMHTMEEKGSDPGTGERVALRVMVLETGLSAVRSRA